jgi:hypothetical protein
VFLYPTIYKIKHKTQALISAAFQDHISKQLKLDGLLQQNDTNSLLTTNNPHVLLNNKKKTETTKVTSKIDTGLNKSSLFFTYWLSLI